MITRVEGTGNFAILQAKKRRAGDTIASVVTLEVTYRCNLRCRHCYLGPFTYGNEAPHGELSTEEMCTVLDQLLEGGTFFIDFTGGEVFYRPDIFKILEHAKKIGLFFGIKTNATLVTEAIADRLKELGVSGVHVSLYGASPATHEYVTGVPGSFVKTVNAIKLLRERKIRVGINSTMLRCNAGEHKNITELGKELGVKADFTPLIFPKVGHPGSADDIRMDDDQLRNLIIEENWIPDDRCLESSNLERHVLCNAGRIRCAISPVGDVLPCVLWRLSLGNLRLQTFADIWQGESARKVRAIELNDFPACVKCEFVNYCARCEGLIQLENENGGVSGPSSVNCRVARALKEVRDARGKENLYYTGNRVGNS